jgi:Mg-chelatase subunit ChlD
MGNAAVKQGNTVPEITTAQASEYDHIVLVDKSGSMATESKRFPGKSRWQEVQEYVKGFVNFINSADEDGITLITFNGSYNVTDNVKDMAAVDALFAKEQPSGSTALHLALQAAFAKGQQSGKPLFVHVFTDGEPTNKDAAANEIANAVRAMKKDADLAVSFLQVGDDPEATAYLTYLDDQLQADKNLPFDAVNAMTVADSEGLTYGQILHLALND